MARGFHLDRRTFLRAGAAGGASVALPLPALDAMFNGNGTALAAGGAIPRRLGVFFWGNGVRPDRWTPKETGANWQLSEELAPLANVKSYLNVVSGLDVKDTGIGHAVGHSSMLSGTYRAGDAASPDGASIDGPTMDQMAAKAWKGLTPFGSLELGVALTRKNGMYRVMGLTAFTGRNVALPCEFTPAKVFDRLFGTKSAISLAKDQAFQRSILDLVKGDAAALGARLGATDKQRLEAHLDGIRSIENRLGFAEVKCAVPPTPKEIPEPLGKEPLDERNKLMAELLAVALTCDLTRVFTIQYSSPQSDTIFWQVGATEGSHILTHDDRDGHNNESQPEKVHKAATFIMGHFAQLLETLKGTPEAGGNLLDNCCVYATSEVSDGTSHSTDDMPVLIAGKAGGALKTGLHYRSSHESPTRALLTCMRSVGLTVDAFGSGPGHETASLSALLN